jgi:hypothetical protein
MEIQTNWTKWGSTDANSFASLRKVWLSLCRLPWNSQVFVDSFYSECWPNMIKNEENKGKTPFRPLGKGVPHSALTYTKLTTT